MLARPSQSARPEAHIATKHWPVVQRGVPLVTEQTAPQPPQFCRSDALTTSHPFAERPSQFEYPEVHALTTHWLALQVDDDVLGSEQAVPHEPQCRASFVVFTSQPSAATPLQSAKPSPHESLHAPPTHAATAFWVGHASSHAPQCRVSF